MALNQQVAMERIRCYKPFNGVLSSFPITNPMHGLFAGEHPVIHHRREIAAAFISIERKKFSPVRMTATAPSLPI